MELINKMLAIASQYNVTVEHDTHLNQFMTQVIIENKNPVHPYIKDSVTWYVFRRSEGFDVTCSLLRYWRSDKEQDVLDLFRFGCQMMEKVG
jgi:hypothetical protein